MSWTSVTRSRTSPIRRKRFSSRTFSSFGWTCTSTSPISSRNNTPRWATSSSPVFAVTAPVKAPFSCQSEEHTSELQSRENLVCRLLLEKKKKKKKNISYKKKKKKKKKQNK